MEWRSARKVNKRKVNKHFTVARGNVHLQSCDTVWYLLSVTRIESLILDRHHAIVAIVAIVCLLVLLDPTLKIKSKIKYRKTKRLGLYWEASLIFNLLFGHLKCLPASRLCPSGLAASG